MGTIRFNKEIRKTVFKLFPMIFSRLLVLVPVVVMSFLNSCDNRPKTEPKKKVTVSKPTINKDVEKILIVGLQPFGDFDSGLLLLEQKEIESFYSLMCKILPAIHLPDMSYYPPRNRFRADSLLNYLESYRHSSIDFLVGLTEKDISCTNEPAVDYGIFGLGLMPGHVCVVSTYSKRLSINASRTLLEERLTKVVLHELGHNLGLDHCNTPNCSMEDTGGTIKTVDRENKEVCPKCSRFLSDLLRPKH